MCICTRIYHTMCIHAYAMHTRTHIDQFTFTLDIVKFLVGDDDKHDLRHRLVQNCDHINDEVITICPATFIIQLS